MVAHKQIIKLYQSIEEKVNVGKKITSKKITEFEKEVYMKLPSDLELWLKYFNGVSIYGVAFLGIESNTTFGETIIDAMDSWPGYWKNIKLIPFLSDGTGGYYLIDTQGQFGKMNSILFTHYADVSPPKPMYVVASNLWKFLYPEYFKLRRSDDEEYQSDKMSWWPSKKKKVLEYDPEMEIDNKIGYIWDDGIAFKIYKKFNGDTEDARLKLDKENINRKGREAGFAIWKGYNRSITKKLK